MKHALNGLTPEREVIEDAVAQLTRPAPDETVSCRRFTDSPMPSLTVLDEVMTRLKAVLFPGYFGDPEVTPDTLPYHTGTHLDVIFRLLAEQIKRGYCFACICQDKSCDGCEDKALSQATGFLKTIPGIREMLSLDVRAAYEGDPAAKSPGETIFCYPSITALIHQRIAHALHVLGVHIIPRIITEMAHSKTGIDIHPGAQIGRGFFIDHGTGTVIGETCVIGDNVRLYHGVTLGAKSFPKDEHGNPMKGLPRHPIVQDDVIIYSGATILGRVTIGKGSVIGANIWLTSDVPPGSHILKTPKPGQG